jgi:hypothetical protein
MRTAIGILCGTALLGVLVYATLQQAAVSCEACVEFGGRSECRTSSAESQEEAVRGAVTAACALLSSGVTQGMQCDRTLPRSVSCRD